MPEYNIRGIIRILPKAIVMMNGEKSMDLQQAGAVLRAEREKRNLSVEDVARNLKIGVRQIRALESGEPDSAVHPAYAKGFIRSYAAWLGLTPEELEGREKAESQDGALPATEGAVSKKGSYGVLWIFAIAMIIAGAVYYSWSENFWGYFEKASTEPASIESTLPTAEEYLSQKDEAAKNRGATATESKSGVENASGEKAAEEAPAAPAQASVPAPVDVPEAIVTHSPAQDQTTKTAEEASNQNPAESPSTPVQAEAVTETVTPVGNHKLIITAIEECWVHSNSDKTDTRQFSLRKGDTFALTFADSLELKLGNAGGVRLRYDGKDLEAPGTSGQVKTLVFPPSE